MGDAPSSSSSTVATSIPPFIDKVVDFPETGVSYRLERPLATYKQCHDGVPAEARMVFTCKRVKHESASSSVEQTDRDSDAGAEFVMKIKVQVPSGDQPPSPGPSTTTAAELNALQIFRDANTAFAPKLVGYKQATQGSAGPLPGGYLTFTVMTKMPGVSLHELHFWGLPAEEREEIAQRFLVALRSIYALGMEHGDCALRNVLWEPETKSCTIIDFELWREASGPITDETKELRRWGLNRQPAAKTWWDAWNTQWR